MNPASGPGSVANSDYQYAVTQLQAAGGTVIGYVPTGYGFRSIADVMADVQSYIDWYSVDGIFLDEMGNSAGSLDYVALYGQIKALATSLGIDLHVVGNPGESVYPGRGIPGGRRHAGHLRRPADQQRPQWASFQNYPNKGPYAGLPLWFEIIRAIDSPTLFSPCRMPARWAPPCARLSDSTPDMFTSPTTIFPTLTIRSPVTGNRR